MDDLWRWSVREDLLYAKTSLNRLTMILTLNDPFREVVHLRKLEYHGDGIVWAIVWDPNKAVDNRGVADP